MVDPDGTDYDYENRLEVHLLAGINGGEIGRDRTVRALRIIMLELEGLVPSFPNEDELDSLLHRGGAHPASMAMALHSHDEDSEPEQLDRRVDVRVHVLLRLPRCREAGFAPVPAEASPCSTNAALNQHILDAWMESWHVLEALYEAKIIYGVGLDGTHPTDVEYLLGRCKVKPQLYRGDVSKALEGYGRRMGQSAMGVSSILKESGATFLASNVAGHVLERKNSVPNAYGMLEHLGDTLYRSHHPHEAESSTARYTVPRLVLAYLVRHSVCVLPRAHKPEHLADDAPESVGDLAPRLTERRVAEIGAALNALITGADLAEDHGLGADVGPEGDGTDGGVAAVFHNELPAGEDALLFRVEDGDSKEIAISVDRGGSVVSGGSVVIVARMGEVFAVRRSSGGALGTFRVSAEAGGAEDFVIT